MDGFGSSAAIAGNTLVIGAPEDDARGTNSGAVYVFVRVGNAWNQQQKIVGSDLAAGANFGSSVAILGSTILVGAPESAGGGAAYIFNFNGTTWTQTIKLQAADRAAGDGFGRSVSLSSVTTRTVALLGAPGDDNAGPAGTTGGTDTGAAYVFSLNITVGSVWTEVEKIMANDGGPGDAFGTSVSLAGSTAVVGAPFDDTVEGSAAGSAYAFAGNTTASTWTQQAKLSSTSINPRDLFGSAVSYQANTAIIGAPYTGVSPGRFRGAFYVFNRVGGVWSEAQRFEDSRPSQFFGSDVALAGDSLVVGGIGNASPGREGTVVLYQRADNVWTLRDELDAVIRNDPLGYYGSSVANSGSVVAIGSYRALRPTTSMRPGAAYLYDVTPLDPAVVTQQPMSASSCRGGTATFDVHATGTSLTYQWGIAVGSASLTLNNGVQPGIGTVSGATTPFLRISQLDPAAGRLFNCVISNTCGTVFSDAASLLLCAADVDDGTLTGACDGGVTIEDLLYYLTLFADGALRADLDDGSTSGVPDGGVTIDDLLYYLFRFDAGC